MASAGPAPGRPATAPWCRMRSMIGEPFQSATNAGLPPMAVPMTVKMPEPITMPTPIAVSETGPRDFLSAFSGSSESEMSLSMDLVAKIWRARACLVSGDLQDCDDCMREQDDWDGHFVGPPQFGARTRNRIPYRQR